jgi:hypothetical protein
MPMRKVIFFVLRISVILSFVFIFACSSAPKKGSPAYTEPVCIQGTVWYQTSEQSFHVRYSEARIYALNHETEELLAETKTDKGGNFCIEVPQGSFKIDLRVLGEEYFEGKSYSCKGGENKIDIGSKSMRCGEDCIQVDIMIMCKEIMP